MRSIERDWERNGARGGGNKRGTSITQPLVQFFLQVTTKSCDHEDSVTRQQPRRRKNTKSSAGTEGIQKISLHI